MRISFRHHLYHHPEVEKQLTGQRKEREQRDKKEYEKNLKDTPDAIKKKLNLPPTLEEDSDSNPVESAIIRRILNVRTELLGKHGLDKVTDAVKEVASYVGDVDEIGSSDVSSWIRQVERILGNEETLEDLDNDQEDVSNFPTPKDAIGKFGSFMRGGVRYSVQIDNVTRNDKGEWIGIGRVMNDPHGPRVRLKLDQTTYAPIKNEVEENLNPQQKKAGQLGPTEKVGKEGAVGKLVGADESIDPLAEIKRMIK
jgi:hypothetical protein